jgi:non-specific serine/threonine protein kinase
MGPTNLPIQLTSFVGREREIADVKRLLSSSHIITLTGTGGCGKTRLAIQVANSMSESFADGAWLVDLSSVHEPQLVTQLVSLALGLHPLADQSLLELLQNYLRSRQLLLIMDNCEHLLDNCALLAHQLITTSSDLRILATSREPLVITGETVFPITGLAWPSTNKDLENDPEELMHYDAVRLFIERARTISPNFKLTHENSQSIVEICQRLDGLPLALELASTRVNVLTVQEITSRLNDRFELLVSNQRESIEMRHHTLRSAIDWSYTLLSVEEQILLRRLAIFEAGCTLDTVEAICTGRGFSAESTLEQISSLVKKSFVVAETLDSVQARYRLLETIREYSLEKLETAGEINWLSNRHLDLFLTRAEEAAPKLTETYQQLWLNWLEGEHNNLRTALAWSLESSRIEEGLRIAIALIRFWEIRGYVQEGLTWFQRLLSRVDESISLVVQANALANASFLAMFLGDAEATMSYGREAVTLTEAAGDVGKPFLVIALAGLASGAKMAGDIHMAFNLEEQGIHLLRESPGQPHVVGMTLLAHGGSAIELGDFDTARLSLNESLAIAREAGDSFRIALALNSLGDLARCEKRYTDAQIAYENSASFMRKVDAQRDLASVLQNHGHACLHLEDVDHAYLLFSESLAINKVLQNKKGMAECLIGFAGVALLRGLPAVGSRLLGASISISSQNTSTGSLWKVTRMEYEYYLELARVSLVEAEFQAELAVGGAMSLDQAVDYVINMPIEPAEFETDSTEKSDRLTVREREVAALIGQGKSNAEIALELVLSKRTVETHVSHILSKLELINRSQVMRWAIDHEIN